MTGYRKTEYLQEMGIPVWQERSVPKGQPAASNAKSAGLKVAVCTDSDSPWLWVIANARLVNSQLLADIRRAAGEPGAGNICYPETTTGLSLEDMIDQQLITRIVLFGLKLDPDDPVRTKSCDILEAPALDALPGSPDLKRKLWTNLQQLMDCQQL